MMPRWRRLSTDGETAAEGVNAPPAADPPSAKRLHMLGSLLLIAGGLILSYPFWSAAYAQVQQDRLDSAYRDSSDDYAETSEEVIGAAPTTISDDELVQRLATAYRKRLKSGAAVGRLRIPRISLDHVVQQGVTGSAGLDPDGDRALLRNGPVHYAVTPLPGAGEPFAIAGHRTTYGAPFFRLDKLRAGDQILVDTPYARFRYAVSKTTEVRPSDVTVLLDRGYGLVLTTCTPAYSASRRLIVWATLETTTPRRPSSVGR